MMDFEHACAGGWRLVVLGSLFLFAASLWLLFFFFSDFFFFFNTFNIEIKDITVSLA